MKRESSDGAQGTTHPGSWLKHLAGLAALVALVVVVQREVGWGTVLGAWTAVPPATGAVCVAGVLASYWLRARRIGAWYADREPRRWLVLKLVLEHNLYVSVLPLRSGEAAFPLLLRRYFGVPLAPALAGLLWLRLLDLHVVLGVALAALALVTAGTTATVLVAAAWIAVAVLALRLRGPGTSVLAGLVPGRWRGRVLSTLNATPTVGLPRMWLLTLLSWGVKLWALATVVLGFARCDAATALLGSVSGELASVLPIPTPAGVGTYEGGVLAGLMPFGVTLEPALAAAVNVHLFVLACGVLAGVAALAIPERSLRHSRRHPGEHP